MRLYPESTFPFATIGDCGEVVTGSTPSKGNPTYWGGHIPFVTPAQLGTKLPITSADEYVTNVGGKRGRLLPEGSVLVCCIGSLGKTGVAGIPLISNQQINSIIFDQNKVDARYGYFAARCLTPLLEHFAPSTTIKIVKKSTFSQLEIPLPPLAEQKRIAAILDAADALRAKRRESLAQLDTLLQSTFLDMFGDPVTNPKGWTVCTLEEATARVTDGTHQSPNWSESGLPFLFVSNIRDRQINFETSKFISEDEWVRLTSRCPIEVGDLLYTTVGSYGNPAVVREGTGRFAFQRHIAHIKPKQDLIDAQFLEVMLDSPMGRHQAHRLARGVAQKTLNLRELKSFQIFLPPLDLQHRFATIVESVEQQKALLRVHLAELDTLFASLQSRAFNGEL